MSQITRCPSCATMFKVVADQLRISDGWVRCGHCKQVFDAAAYLQAQPPAPLMQDLALDKLRAPPQPVRRAEPAAKTWGPTSAPPPRSRVETTQPQASVPPVPNPEPPAPVEAPSVLQVPEPSVPPFLALEPLPGQAGSDIFGRARTAGVSKPLPPSPESVAPSPSPALSEPKSAAMDWPAIEFEPVASPVATPSGYELPTPVWQETEFGIEPDADWPTARHPEPDRAPPAQTPEPPTERALRDALHDVLVQREASQAAQATVDTPVSPVAVAVTPTRKASAPLPPDTALNLTLDGAAAPGVGEVALQLEGDPLPQAMPTALQDDASPEDDASAGELSFVRAARRKAFWRKPLVRTGLALLGVCLLCALLLQVAVQERNFVTATWPQARAPLETLCRPLHCAVGPYRQIAAVEVDGSSFHKVRGDEYQFSLTLKNRARIPVEMPSIELTLTDAQDQSVVRRVLSPPELAAPTEIAAQGEWSATTSILIASGGARITGYRVLAFYP